jgi:hypothetical protein
MNLRIDIAEELLGCRLEAGGFAPCPGKQHHTKGAGKRDFRVILDGAPTGFCFHASCADEVAAFNKELRRRIWFAEHGNDPAPRGSWGEDVTPAPTAPLKARPEIDRTKLEEFTRGVPAIDFEWLRRRSPKSVESAKSGFFLDALYEDGDRVLIFTAQYSQGDFLWWVGHGGFRLSPQRGVKAVPSALPAGGREGVWFLVQPVSGKWSINANEAKAGGAAKWSRRWEGEVRVWRYFVLESDELDSAEWLRVVVSFPFPIAAIYTSGKRSIHALVRFDVGSKAEWDAVRNVMRQIVCPLGADPAALSAVRLSRLPGCKRGENLQQLLYLNPNPDHTPIRLLPEARE